TSTASFVIFTLSLHDALPILLAICISYGQNKFELLDGERSEKVSFDFINNLIVLEVEVNKIPLSFIVDTGVNKPILFDISPEDSDRKSTRLNSSHVKISYAVF